MKDISILDNASTMNSISNEELCDEVYESDWWVEMSTNAGVKTIKKQAKIKGLSEKLDPNEHPIWFDKDGVTNIMSSV